MNGLSLIIIITAIFLCVLIICSSISFNHYIDRNKPIVYEQFDSCDYIIKNSTWQEHEINAYEACVEVNKVE